MSEYSDAQVNDCAKDVKYHWWTIGTGKNEAYSHIKLGPLSLAWFRWEDGLPLSFDLSVLNRCNLFWWRLQSPLGYESKVGIISLPKCVSQ